MMNESSELNKTLRLIIYTQCAGTVSTQLLQNGFILAYSLQLGLPPHGILLLFSMLSLVGMVLTLPLAYLSDRIGKKRMGTAGAVLSLIGMLLMPLAGFGAAATSFLWVGILIFSIGNAANTASWFALLSPIIPAEIRGRFFGRLRVSWQTFSLLVSLGIARLLSWNHSVAVYQAILAGVAALLVVRLLVYQKIPELEPERADPQGFWVRLAEVVRIPGYLSFCCYLFLVALFTGATVTLFGLLEKEVLGLSDSRIVVLGNWLACGAIAGFFLGGKMVDRWGTRRVFLLSHGLFGLILIGFSLREYFGPHCVVLIGLVTVLFGAVNSAFSIAASSEMLALIPPQNKSLSTGLYTTLTWAGVSASNLLVGQALKLQLFAPQWNWGALKLTAYDTVLLGGAVLMFLTTVTLGLVPSVLGVPSQSLPLPRR